MKAALLVLALAAGGLGCSKSEASARAQRVNVVQKSPTSFELVPSEGLPPYCHVFMVTATGYVQHHTATATDDLLSLECPAGAVITNRALKVPKREGKVKAYVIFSDQPIEGRPISNQINDLVSQRQPVTAFDLRAPGRVIVETLEFNPPG
jgi:hypothetical protein